MKLDSGADDAYMRDRDTQISPQGEYILAYVRSSTIYREPISGAAEPYLDPFSGAKRFRVMRQQRNVGLLEPKSRRRRNTMQDLLNQFKALTDEEKLAFMKEAMSAMAEIFRNDPQKMMNEMMPVCMNVMKSKGMDMGLMRNMMKNMMG